MKRTKARLHKGRLVVSFVLIVIVTVLFAGTRIIATPSHGHTTHTATATSVQNKQIPATTPAVETAENNQYYSLLLSASYRPQNGGEQTPGVLARQRYIKTGMSGSQIVVISIEQAPSGGLSQLSAYQLRTSTGRYVKTSKSAHGQQVDVFSDSQSSSVVAFWLHNGVVASIGVSAGLQDMTDTGNRAQQAVITEILAAWQWR